MYKILVDGATLYDPRIAEDGYIVTEATAELQLNATGSASFTIPPCNPLYNSINKLLSIVEIFDDDDLIFRGRVLHDERDFDNNKNVYCEGELSFLADNIISPRSFSNKTVAEVFNNYISVYNTQVEANKRFTVGTVNVTGTVDYVSYDFEGLLDCINNRLIEPYGGYIRTRYTNGVHYIDYLSNYTHVCDQMIEFGSNLLDFTEYVGAENIVTVLIPLGKQKQDANGEYIGRVNITSVNSGHEYVHNQAAQNLFGNVWKVEVFDDIEDPSELKAAGQKLLNQNLAASTTLTLKAFDLSLINVEYEEIKIGDGVRVFSAPHNLDQTFQCSRINYNLLDPANSEYEFGTPQAKISAQTAQLSSNVKGMAVEPKPPLTEEEIERMQAEIMKGIPTFNLLPNLYYEFSISGNIFSKNGITWTLNADGSITAKGATANTGSACSITGVGTLALTIDPTKTYTLSGCPVGGSNSTYTIGFRAFRENETPAYSGGYTGGDIGQGATIPIGYKYLYIYCWIYANYTCPSAGVTFLPMLEVGTAKHSFISTTTNSATIMSDIAQNATNIQSKVSSTDYTGQKIVSMINQTASTVTIAAQHIFASGDVINLTGKNISINSTTFSVDSTGYLVCTNANITGTLHSQNFKFGAMESVEPETAGGDADVWVRHALFVDYGIEILAGTSSNSPYIDFHTNITSPRQHNATNDFTARITNNQTNTIRFYGNVHAPDPSATARATCIAGSWNVESDRRLKRNIKQLALTSSKSFISSLKPSSFEYRSEIGITHHGFIYDEVDKSKYDANWAISEMYKSGLPSGDRYGAINVIEMVPDLVMVVQDQMQEIAELKQRLINAGL